MSIAIVQAGSIIYDTPATLDKLERFTKEAASHGAKLVLFPGALIQSIDFIEKYWKSMSSEAFIGGYPKGMDFGIVLGSRSPEGREEFRK